ncbi:MAG: phage baseplate protein [Terriglobia bacterium]|nr:MAG: phage baseplate protein [Terriglobia bacterium]
MRALLASDLLDVWERGLAQMPLGRAATLLATAFPDRPTEQLESLPIGRRDALLLALRERTFGPSVNAVTSCEKCKAAVELNFQIADLRVDALPEQELVEVTIGEYTLRLRLPNSADLARILPLAARNTEAVEALFRACLDRAEHAGASVEAVALSEEIIGQAIEAVAQADPQADIRLAIECPECGFKARVPFDIVSFLWREIEDFAIRTLREIHALASAYGWSEDQILALGPVRRRCYLEMVGA